MMFRIRIKAVVLLLNSIIDCIVRTEYMFVNIAHNLNA